MDDVQFEKEVEDLIGLLRILRLIKDKKERAVFKDEIRSLVRKLIKD